MSTGSCWTSSRRTSKDCFRAGCCWRSTGSLRPAAQHSIGCRRRCGAARRPSRSSPPISRALGDSAAARRTVDALAVHPALTEADVLAVLPALPEAAGGEIAASLLEALDRRGLASTRWLRALASIQVTAGSFGEARHVLERVAAAEGASAPLLIELARTAIRLKDYEGALGYLAHARSLDPGSATVHFLFAMVCVEQNLGREAYDSMKKAVELDPDNPLVNYAMGAIATNRHEPSESLPYFEKYVRLQPDDPRGHFALGAALFYSNQFDRGPSRARTRHPLARDGHRRPLLSRAHRPADERSRHGAPGNRSHAASSMPRLADAWAELGLIQTRLEDYGAAEQSLGRALAIDPDHYAASVNLATLYARTKDPRKDAQMARSRRSARSGTSGPRHSCESSRPCPTDNEQDRRCPPRLRDRLDSPG